MTTVSKLGDARYDHIAPETICRLFSLENGEPNDTAKVA
jgi:hypothetical protein